MNTQIANIAETLRGYVNTNNDAKRLIAEHIFPLLGLPGSADAIERMLDAADTMAVVAEELDDIATALEEIADKPDEIETDSIIDIVEDILTQSRYLTSF